MTKRTIYLSVCLLLMLVMYNCKKKDEPLPDKPNQGKVDEINKITIPAVTTTAPAAVTVTASSITPSAEATALSSSLTTMATSGVVPASVTATGAAVTAAIPAADLTVLSAVSPATLAAVKAGGAIPADVKAAYDKALANPAIQAYLPKFTLPTVNGKAVTGRIGAVGDANTATAAADAVEAIEGTLATDACIASSEAAFQTVKVKLDASKSAQDLVITNAYTAAIATLAADETACQAGVNYTAQRTAADTQINEALANVEAAKAVLTAAGLYDVLKSLINVQGLGIYTGISTNEKADKAACTATRTAKIASAATARDGDLAKIKANYDAAIVSANAIKVQLAQSCHNQGAGL